MSVDIGFDIGFDIGADLQKAYDEGYADGKRDAAPRWVRCEERLPEPNTDIVFVAKYSDTYETDIGSMSKDGKWWGYEVWHQNKNVICWMPLPELPKEGE